MQAGMLSNGGGRAHCRIVCFKTTLPAGSSPRPPFVIARARSLQLLHRLESCTRPCSCSREAIRLVVLASLRKSGTTAATSSSRAFRSKIRPAEEGRDPIGSPGLSQDRRRGLPLLCRCSSGGVCKVILFIYSAFDRAIGCLHRAWRLRAPAERSHTSHAKVPRVARGGGSCGFVT